MMELNKKIVSLSLVATLGFAVGPVALQSPSTIVEASALSTLASGAAAMAYVSSVINKNGYLPRGLAGEFS